MTPEKDAIETDDLTPVIWPFGPGTEEVHITQMSGRQLEAALKYFPADLTGPSGRWGKFLRDILRKFRAAGGKPTDRVASLVDLSPGAVLRGLRHEDDDDR
jgi:hypothetical protein